MHYVIEKALLDTLFCLIDEAVHRHPPKVIRDFIDNVKANIKPIEKEEKAE